MRERRQKDGTVSYQALFRDGTKQRSKTFDNEKDALVFLDRVRVLGVKEALVDEDALPSGVTLDQLAALYWPWKAGRVRSDRTVVDYERDYNNWISPHLGHQHAAAIDEGDVQAWIDKIKAMKKDGKPMLSPKSVADRHAILHGIFKWASAPTRKHVPLGHNPTIGTELPKRRKKMPQGLKPAEWQALHAAMKTINADAADLAEFLIASGLRWSEATALSASHVEDDGTYVWVTVTHVARRGASGQVEIVEDTKSEKGQRRIKLDADIARVVRRRLKQSGNGLVFTTRAGSQWNYSHFYARVWKRAVAAANIGRPVTPHMLRHSAVGYMALSGKVSLAEIQRRVGHQSITTTIDVYGGMIEDVKDEALDFMAAMRNAKPAVLDSTDEAALEA